jgi:hypothetical protein
LTTTKNKKAFGERLARKGLEERREKGLKKRLAEGIQEGEHSLETLEVRFTATAGIARVLTGSHLHFSLNRHAKTLVGKLG